MVRPRFDWLTYNEPEGHLDELVSRLLCLPGLKRDSRIIGMTYKDDSTLGRFDRLGYSNTYRYRTDADLGLEDRCAGLESLQSALASAEVATTLAARHGRADLLILRHALEHVHEPADFLRAVKQIVRPGGYLVVEVPDCTKFVRGCDHSFVWEEHIVYFSPRTLAAFLSGAGFAVQEIIVHPYPLEDSLIAIARNDSHAGVQPLAHDEVDAMFAEGRFFAESFPSLKDRLQRHFAAWRGAGKRVTVFGAGHLAAKFVNLFELADFIEYVLDDNPRKQELLMPGSRLPIRGSEALYSRPIDYCLLSLNPESEQKVLARHRSFLDRGGRFFSIFALSSRSVYQALAS
jgi:SAM-dependent methyltransferase